MNVKVVITKQHDYSIYNDIYYGNAPAKNNLRKIIP